MIPVKMIIKALDIMGPTLTKLIISWHLLAKILPITAAYQTLVTISTMRSTKATWAEVQANIASGHATTGYISAATLLFGVRSLMTALTWKNI